MRLGPLLAFLLFAPTACAQNKDMQQRLDWIMETARERHVDQPSQERLYKGAIDGALQALDPYSTFLDETDLARLERRIGGHYTGIGVEIGIRDNRLTVISPIEDSPAEAAGIKAGDKILEIDGKSTKGMTTRDSTELLLGKEGTNVDVTVYSPGQEKSKRTVTLTRARITLKGATVELRDDKGRKVAHIRLRNFQRQTVGQIIEGLEPLGPMDGVVLDVRNNPGGLLSSAVGVCELFLTKGVIVSTVLQGGKPGHIHKVRNRVGPKWLRAPDLPIVVLINRGSASASEIVAGALQDRGRAVLIGEKSYGKGSVQSIIRKGKTALKLTTARYALPSGRIIDGKGLTPDLGAARLEKDQPDAGMKLGLDVIRSWKALRGARPSSS